METYIKYENNYYEVIVAIKKKEIKVTKVGFSLNNYGIIAQVMFELGTPLVNVFRYKTSREIRNEIILACGYKFSKSNLWKGKWSDLWNVIVKPVRNPKYGNKSLVKRVKVKDISLSYLENS